jgi:hypothetical protein
MVVDDAARLHRRVDGRRPDEAEARALERRREGLGLGRRGVPVGVARRWVVALRGVRPDQLRERRRVTQRDRRARVRDRRLDLPAVADDRRVREQPLDVALSEPGDAIRVEALEGGAKRLALAQDRQPGEPRLEAFEAEPLVQPALVANRSAPLLVVVGVVGRVGGLPAADDGGYATSTFTTPSSTTTG